MLDTLCLQSVVFADLGVEEGGFADDALLVIVVDPDEAKTRPESFVPFEVVEERPVEVAADVDAFLDSAVDPEEVIANEFETLVVKSIGQSVFGDIDREMVLLELFQNIVDAFGVEFPPEVTDRFISQMNFPRELEAVVEIVLDSEEVMRTRGQAEHVNVREKVREADHERVKERVLVIRLEGMEEIGQSDLGIRIDVVNGVVGSFVSVSQDMVDAVGEDIAFFLGRPLAGGVGAGDDGRRFVEGDPELHLVVQFIDDMPGIALEACRKLFGGDAALVAKPERQRPVPESDEWFHATLMERRENLAIVSDGRLVKLPFHWFDTRPFDGKTMSVVVERPSDVEILAETVIVIAGDARDIVLWIFGFGAETFPVFDMAEFRMRLFSQAVGVFFFPFGPVIGGVALDLVGRGGSTPEEAFWK